MRPPLPQIEPMTSAEFVKIRRRLGLSQQRLAYVLDKAVTTISRWETSTEPIGPTVALAMRRLEAEAQAVSGNEEVAAAAPVSKSVTGKR